MLLFTPKQQEIPAPGIGSRWKRWLICTGVAVRWFWLFCGRLVPFATG